jgi:hypothetical protein
MKKKKRKAESKEEEAKKIKMKKKEKKEFICPLFRSLFSLCLFRAQVFDFLSLFSYSFYV